MKTLILSMLFVYTALGGFYTPEQATTFRTTTRECQEATKIDRKLIENVFNNKQCADDDVLKQFLFCFYKKENFMGEDGKINKVALKKFAENVPSAVGTAINMCLDQTASTGEETAFLLATCALEKVPNDVDTSLDF